MERNFAYKASGVNKTSANVVNLHQMSKCCRQVRATYRIWNVLWTDLTSSFTDKEKVIAHCNVYSPLVVMFERFGKNAWWLVTFKSILAKTPEVHGNMMINNVSITWVHASIGQLFPKSDAIKFLKVLPLSDIYLVRLCDIWGILVWEGEHFVITGNYGRKYGDITRCWINIWNIFSQFWIYICLDSLHSISSLIQFFFYTAYYNKHIL